MAHVLMMHVIVRNQTANVVAKSTVGIIVVLILKNYVPKIIVETDLWQTVQMKIAARKAGLVMAYVMVKIKLGAATYLAMMMMEVTVVQSIHAGIVHV